MADELKGSVGRRSTSRALALMGDAADINTWSNIPYFLYEAGRSRGWLSHALDLTDTRYRANRMIWNAMAPLRLERPGGYQYSRIALQRMWDCVPEAVRGGEIVSHFQLFPPIAQAQASGATFSFYVDATLRQLYANPATTPPMGWRTYADALSREKEGYQAAYRFVAMARQTAAFAIEHYGLNPAKVFVVRPGANLDEDVVRMHLGARGPSWREAGPVFSQDNPARLGFVGRDYQRKGLPRLVEAAEILHRRGRAVRVTIIGHCPEHLQRHELVEWVGLIRKGNQMREFVEAVDRFAMGCLPSYAEPLGISTLECLRLGVPVMGARVGGIPDCVSPDVGFLVPADATGEDIADGFDRCLFDPATYASLVRNATALAGGVTWDHAVRQLQAIWEPTALGGQFS